MQIEIDFDVFKALTVRRRNEAHTYNDVLREILNLAPSEVRSTDGKRPAADVLLSATSEGLHLKGLFLPDGTLLRADYKGKRYQAQIVGGQWLDSGNVPHTSPSAAAWAITNTSVNGWRFWYAKRPSDQEWRKLEALQKTAS